MKIYDKYPEAREYAPVEAVIPRVIPRKHGFDHPPTTPIAEDRKPISGYSLLEKKALQVGKEQLLAEGAEITSESLSQRAKVLGMPRLDEKRTAAYLAMQQG